MFKAFGFVATMHQESRFYVDFMCHMKSCMSCGSPNLDTVSQEHVLPFTQASALSLSPSLFAAASVSLLERPTIFFLSSPQKSPHLYSSSACPSPSDTWPAVSKRGVL